MNKQYLLSVIDKYHLNGIVEGVRWNIKDKNINISFNAPNKDMMGFISAPEFDLEDADIAIFNTSTLYKLLNITEQNLLLTLHKEQTTFTKLLIADTNYNLEYVLANTMMVSKGGTVNDAEYKYSFKIDKELIDKFIKAKKSLPNTELVSIESINGKQIKFILGENNKFSNKVEFFTPSTADIKSNPILFNAEYIKEIFDVNKNISNGLCSVCEDGLMKIEIKDDKNVESTYYLIAKE